MGKCSACGKYYGENEVFCLHCGSLLADYSDAKLENIDYELKGDEFLERVAEEFLKTGNQFHDIMFDFSSSIGGYGDDITSVSKNSDLEYHARILEYSKIFDGLSKSFDEVMNSLQEPTFSMLVFSDIIWNESLEYPELRTQFGESQKKLITSLNNLVDSCENLKAGFNDVVLPCPDESFDASKSNLLSRFDKFIIFNKSFVRELKFIKDKCLNNNHMASEDNHNHFCIYCGARIDADQNFCSDCGKPVFRQKEQAKPQVKTEPSRYSAKIDELEQKYNAKQSKAKELVEKQFDPNHMAYERFMTSINKSNNLFDIQVGIARKMDEMDFDRNPFVEKELDEKINMLQTFIDKMEDLTNELVIHLSSNKKDNDDINNLFNDMDDLIDSVKDY